MEAMEIWYTLTGDVDKRGVQDAIAWINSELYSKSVDRLRFLIAAQGGDIGAGINLHTYLKALPIEVETVGFGEVDAAAVLADHLRTHDRVSIAVDEEDALDRVGCRCLKANLILMNFVHRAPEEVLKIGGKIRRAVEGCQFFFHEGRYTLQDQTAPIHAHEEAISVFKRQLHEMIYIIAFESKNDTETVAGMLRRSKIMLTSEAKDFGLCHEIIKQLPLQQQEDKGVGFVPKRAD